MKETHEKKNTTESPPHLSPGRLALGVSLQLQLTGPRRRRTDRRGRLAALQRDVVPRGDLVPIAVLRARYARRSRAR